MTGKKSVGNKRTSLYCALKFCEGNFSQDVDNIEDITKNPRILLEGSSIIRAIVDYYFLPTRYNKGFLPSDQSGFLRTAHEEIINSIEEYNNGELIFDAKYFQVLGKSVIEKSFDYFPDLRKEDLRTELFSISKKLMNLEDKRLALTLRLICAGIGSKIEERIEQLYFSKNLEIPVCHGFEDTTCLDKKLSFGSEYYFLSRKVEDVIQDFNRRAYPFNKW
ncbi:MAG TPA: hypothetical protein PLX15_05565 [Candidatus Woesearchaeota archaeon]|mgnify:CR=1 FL=1|nr:hypothetical protein [Candidatus Woesearchaeota archaeon]